MSPKRSAQARDFAAKINAAASRAAAATDSSDDAQAADPIEQLRKLSELRDAGIVSTEEFDAKKAELLDRL